MTKHKNSDDITAQYEQRIAELTEDLQRTRADFENYRKRMEIEKQQSRDAAAAATILKLLPVIDTLERALSHIPEQLKDNSWVAGIMAMKKNLDKSLQTLNLQRVEASQGAEFNPDFHEAVQMDDSEGDLEVIKEELQAGYLYNGQVLRHSMVKVTKK